MLRRSLVSNKNNYLNTRMKTIATDVLAKELGMDIRGINSIREALGHQNVNGSMPVEPDSLEVRDYYQLTQKGAAASEAISQVITNRQQSEQPTKAPKGKGGMPKGVDKHVKGKEEGQGKLVAAKKDLTRANLQVRAKEGRQLADQGAVVLVETYLGRTAENYGAIATSILNSGNVLMGITDEVGSEFDLEAEVRQDFLDSEEQAALPGAFSL